MSRRSGTGAGQSPKHLPNIVGHKIGHMIAPSRSRPEYTMAVTLSCGCVKDYPRPWPRNGEVVWCRKHDTAARVQGEPNTQDHRLTCGHAVRYAPPYPSSGRLAYCPVCETLTTSQGPVTKP